MNLTITLLPEGDGWYSVQCHQCPDVITQGPGISGALSMFGEALELSIEEDATSCRPDNLLDAGPSANGWGDHGVEEGWGGEDGESDAAGSGWRDDGDGWGGIETNLYG